jgi:putative hemolysin
MVDAVILVALLLCTALFSAAEIAVTMSSRVRLRTRAERGAHGARRAELLLVHPDRAIATCLVANTLSLVALAEYGRSALMRWHRFEEPIAELIVTAILVPVVLVCGETIPKAIAQAYPNRALAALALPLEVVRWVVWPLSQVSFGVVALVRRLARQRSDLRAVLSREELKQFVAHSEKHGHVDRGERELIERIVEFWKRDPARFARRIDGLPCLRVGVTAGEAKEWMREQRISRLLLCDEAGTSVVGVVTAAALLDVPNAAPVTRVLQPPVHVDPTRGVDRVLAELQRSPAQVGVLDGSTGSPRGASVLLLDDLLGQVLGRPLVLRPKQENP